MKKFLFLTIVTITIAGVNKVNAQTSDTFTDTRDGKTYKTVKIGEQVWMAENLAYKVNYGCWAYNDNENYVSKYGYLYNSETAKNVCPTGYHLPKKSEFDKLLKNYGGIKDEKINFNALSENGVSGFSGLLGGYKSGSSGNYEEMGTTGNFWSASGVNYLMMAKNHKGAFGGYGWTGAGIRGYAKSCGLSVRCVKD